MSARLRIGVMGAGAIGCYLGGRLLASETAEVVLVGRPGLRDDIAARGIAVQAFDGELVRVEPAAVRFHTEAAALSDCDVVMVCVKSGQTAGVGRELDGVLAADTIVISLQNGVRNPDTLRGVLGDRTVLGAVVGFNVVWRDGAVFHRTTSGPLTLESCTDERFARLVNGLGHAGVAVDVRPDIAPHQWAKLIVNLNNAVSALSGAPTRSLVLEPGYRRVVAAVMREGVRVLDAAGVKPARMRGLPVGMIARMLSMPTPLVRVMARAQMRIDPEARSSMYQDLARGRLTEVDHLNGEIVSLAEQNGVDAPLNRRITEMVHDAETRADGSPELPADQLWSALTASSPGAVPNRA